MLRDTGASISVISSNLWKKIKQPNLLKSNIVLNGAFSSGRIPLGRCRISLLWNKKLYSICVVVINDINPDFIAGMDLITKIGYGIKPISNIDSKTVSIKANNEMRMQKLLDRINGSNNYVLPILKQYIDIFMAHEFDIGITNRVEHKILSDSKPIFVNPRRQPIHFDQALEMMLTQLERSGIIKKCSSPWNTPLILVGKKDGSIRMCLDFRMLNSVITKESFPMTDIKSVFNSLNGVKMFSSIDLGKAYYQIPLEEESQLKTAFSSKKQQYCFRRLPFIISTAPAIF
jgi:hypothetical protein